MENSNCGCECAFVKAGFIKCDKECPMYTETWWTLEGKADPKLVKDCFPKKFALEQNHLLHRQLCLQGVVEDVRNRMDRIETMLINLTSQSKEFIIEKRLESIESKQEKIKELNQKIEDKQ